MIRHILPILCFLTFACAPTSTITSKSSVTDVELESAILQARDSLDTFITKIAAPHANRTFVAIKVRFAPSGEMPQDIWVDEVLYKDGVFQGNIGDDIPTLKLEAGERIEINESAILDWMIVEDEKLIGGYTICLAVQHMSPEEREQFLETLDYSIED